MTDVFVIVGGFIAGFLGGAFPYILWLILIPKKERQTGAKQSSEKGKDDGCDVKP